MRLESASLSDASTDLSRVTNSDTVSEGSQVLDPQLKRARQAIAFSKATVLVVFLGALLALSSAVYNYVRLQEQRAFESDFENFASRAIAVSAKNVKGQFEAVDQLSIAISAAISASSMSWPQVIVPGFDALAKRVVDMTDAVRVIMAILVEEEERSDFEPFLAESLPIIIQRTLNYQNENTSVAEIDGIPETIMGQNLEQEKYPETLPGPYLVQTHRYPFSLQEPVFQGNNLLSWPSTKEGVRVSNITKASSISFASILDGIRGQIFQPIFDNVDQGKIVAIIWLHAYWENILGDLLPGNAVGLNFVVTSACGFEVTFEINGGEAKSIGIGDFHDDKYDDFVVEGDLFNIPVEESIQNVHGICADKVSLRVYPSDEFKDAYRTNEPILFAGTVLAIFGITFALFILYDVAVNRRQMSLVVQLNKQEKIVSDLFPRQIMTRLMAYGSDETSIALVDVESKRIKKKNSIADLYPECTVMYADIQGFVAWSSQRQPHEIFTLLEAINADFDKMARHYKVFKIEAVGDSYLCVTGVPNPTPAHAVQMARFARACVVRASKLTTKLEVILGPDTGDLEVRIGIHSGQVTAGVLRGDRQRFQLFGTTVNMTEQIKNSSVDKSIHISEATAKLLRKCGHGRWVEPRSSLTTLEGLGEVQTYWLLSERGRRPWMNAGPGSETGGDETSRQSEFDLSSNASVCVADMTKMQRLVEYNLQALLEILKEVVTARNMISSSSMPPTESLSKIENEFGRSQTVLEEFKEIITLPKTAADDIPKRQSSGVAELPVGVKAQLRAFLTEISLLYRDNPFHNYEHAAHVTASVIKMLKRIVDTDDANRQASNESSREFFRVYDLAGHSYGITSDPLTQFAVVFSAVIHDAAHPGIPNSQLVIEGTQLAKKYKNKSVAEQNSVDEVWRILMDPLYADLRQCLYTTEEELRRFRQLVVNIVMATDICDKELGQLRKNRWDRAFSQVDAKLISVAEDMDRKATIVLEHLIQASDVSHTMQHWDIYRLWNERFFNECYGAFKTGRAESDPSTGWYKGEIGFFDFYVIPLAKKLENCGVFGVSSHEYLGYAESNRELWVQQGELIVQGYLAKFEEGNIDTVLPSAAMTEPNDCDTDVVMMGHEVDPEQCSVISI